MIKTRVYQLAKGLTRAAALRAARALDGGRDFRGFTYDPRSGRATLT